MRSRGGTFAGWAGGIAAVVALMLALLAPGAQAVEIIEGQAGTAADGWQAATCKTDLPECSPETGGQFFTQAAGHPGVGFTQFIVKHGAGLFGAETPVGDVHTLQVDLPPGLSVNPQATEQCALAEGESPEVCATRAPGSKVGTSVLTAALVIELVPGLPMGKSMTLPKSDVYNLIPKQGQPARFGFSTLGNDVFLEPGVAYYSDYHEFFRIAVPKLELPSIPGIKGVRVLKNRLIFEGNVGKGVPGRGAFLTNPSTCLGGHAQSGPLYSTFLHADSYQEIAPAFPAGSQALESPLPPGVQPTGCANVPFAPAVSTAPATTVTDAPFGPAINLTVPFDPSADIANSNLRIARVTTPLGVGLNPAAATNLVACTDAQFGQGTTTPVLCPAGSAIGTVAIQTPVLPANSLSGTVFLANQLSRDPESGNEYRIFIDAESPRYGQSVRLTGRVSANAISGQLTTVVNEAPQLPFTSIQVAFNGSKGVLTSPPTCGPNITSGLMTPWSGTADKAIADKGFTLTTAPNGKPCAKTLAERPLTPGFSAHPVSSQVATYTPYQLQITRTDGQQELKGLNLVLPPGATAKLAGVPYCPPSAFNAATVKSGREEEAKPSCPSDSEIGVATVLSGAGAAPLKIEGNAYLAGPYKGAPLSIVVITPGVAGPFDLGNVVVRAPLNLDPESAQIEPSAELPDVFGGVKLDIRSIFVNINRKEFTLNGTNCKKSAVAGNIFGGGANPAVRASWSSVPVSEFARGVGCKALKFKPKLHLRLFGATHRNQNPKLRAALVTKDGQANIARASVALPHAIFLDQASLASVCTRVQFAAENCPKKSVYGHARAFSPLLGKPLEGPVYLRSSSNELPDLVAHLEGQVTIDLDGKIDSFKGGIRTTFNHVPDVPVTKFVLTLPGGKHGLLVASTNLCKKPVKGIIRFTAQNSRRAHSRPTIKTPCSGKKKSNKKHAKGKKHKKGSKGKKEGGKGKKKGGKTKGQKGKSN